MDLAVAKAQAESGLRHFVEQELTTPVLNSIENIVNGLIYSWARDHRFFVHDGNGRVVKGIKIWYDEHNGSLRTEFRYPDALGR